MTDPSRRVAMLAAIGGLAGTVVVQNNGGDTQTITANGSFAFATPILVGLLQTGGLWIGAPRADLGRLAPGRPRVGTLAGVEMGLDLAKIPHRSGGVLAAMDVLKGRDVVPMAKAQVA